ncbi:INTERPRO: probable Peptidase S8 and S53, subtilisin, kexin, sedolisin [Aromatoleum aromaticum EbN1]|uniref:INTERPRO: probable Peptidase S8 and S53, subtilisin, kexin, sedolisin n=1 Tax=Aromatoleum aromaticum (strain DSM 19018 / LMG 30748 / EbN1) TaxID=76114 RepID=Q5P1Z1_AROAE|nr:INTERPRO: probable Peptidase S8 and S53, subtilisin, kexin, sedolisin [Aromatoleum aromaticum EbN1]
MAPQTIGTQQEIVAGPCGSFAERDLRRPVTTEARQQDSALRMRRCRDLVQPAPALQFGDQRMVLAAAHRLASTKVIDAGITAVNPARLSAPQHQRDSGAVRIRPGAGPNLPDTPVGVGDDPLQQLPETAGVGNASFEIPPRLEHHLLSRKFASSVSAHAIGKNGHHRATPRRVPEHRDAILLFAPIPDMPCDASFDDEGHGEDRD